MPQSLTESHWASVRSYRITKVSVVFSKRGESWEREVQFYLWASCMSHICGARWRCIWLWLNSSEDPRGCDVAVWFVCFWCAVWWPQSCWELTPSSLSHRLLMKTEQSVYAEDNAAYCSPGKYTLKSVEEKRLCALTWTLCMARETPSGQSHASRPVMCRMLLYLAA